MGGLITLLGLAVLIRERNSPVAQAFWFLTFSVAVWLLCYGLAFLAQSETRALEWIRIAQLGICLIPSSVLLFTLLVVGYSPHVMLYTAPCFALSFLFYGVDLKSHALINGAYPYPWGFYGRYGFLSIPFLVFFFTVLFLSLAVLWKGYQKAKPGENARFRLGSLLSAFSIGYLAGVDYLAAYGIEVYPFGYLLVLAFIVMSAHAIWRYRLVDITPSIAANQILETMQGAVLVVDLEGRICVANRCACTMSGYQKGELMGMPVTAIIESPIKVDVNPFGRKREITIENNIVRWRKTEIFDHPMTWRTRQGQSLKVKASASVLRDHTRSPVGVVYTAMDLSRPKKSSAV